MKIGGTIFYFTIQEEPKPLYVIMKIGGEIDLPVEVILVKEKIIDEEENKKMLEWSFSGNWNGNISFDTSSGGGYNCLIKAGTSVDSFLIQKTIRVGVRRETA